MAKETKNENNEQKINNPKNLVHLLQQPSIKVAEFLTGFLTSGLGDWKLSAGRIVQASIKFELLTQLGRELQEYIKKGRIQEDYYATNMSQASLNELLTFVDSEVPDKERFKAMNLYSSPLLKWVHQMRIRHWLMNLCKFVKDSQVATF